jgi:hypothetical protein
MKYQLALVISIAAIRYFDFVPSAWLHYLIEADPLSSKVQ